MCRATCRGSSKALFQHSFGTGWGLSKMGIEFEMNLKSNALCQACGGNVATAGLG